VFPWDALMVQQGALTSDIAGWRLMGSIDEVRKGTAVRIIADEGALQTRMERTAAGATKKVGYQSGHAGKEGKIRRRVDTGNPEVDTGACMDAVRERFVGSVAQCCRVLSEKEPVVELQLIADLTSQSIQVAQVLPNMLPIWRIHRHGENVEMDTKFMSGIERADTIAIFKRLGDGDARKASGSLVLTCDYADELKDGTAAVVARIQDVKGDTNDGKGPPFSCSLQVLGRILCNAVDLTGDYPQAEIGLIPVWKIHNFNSSDDAEHKITNIGREDSLALLEYVGGGDRLAANGALVLGCDFKEDDPVPGQSMRWLKVSGVAFNESSQRYDATLVEKGTVFLGSIQTSAHVFPSAVIDMSRMDSRALGSVATIPISSRSGDGPTEAPGHDAQAEFAGDSGDVDGEEEEVLTHSRPLRESDEPTPLLPVVQTESSDFTDADCELEFNFDLMGMGNGSTEESDEPTPLLPAVQAESSDFTDADCELEFNFDLMGNGSTGESDEPTPLLPVVQSESSDPKEEDAEKWDEVASVDHMSEDSSDVQVCVSLVETDATAKCIASVGNDGDVRLAVDPCLHIGDEVELDAAADQAQVLKSALYGACV